MVPSGSFDGFGEHAPDFYEGLEADNSKAYWTDHREVYEEQVRAPMLALLADLEAEFGAGTVFRPYRDVRFSKDKTPYKTHCGGVVRTPGGAFYTQVGADGLLVAGGGYRLAADQLARLRAAIDDDRRGTDLQRRLAAAESAGLTVGGDTLRTRPRGVDPDHPRLGLLRHRSLHLSRHWPPDEELHGPACLDRVRAGWRAVRPLNDWLADHVGASELPPR